VIACVCFAREHDLPISVRGGGHSIAGKAICDDGLTIDLSAMKGIRVDPARHTVRAEPGLTIGEFDRETQAFGLATTTGVISTTGIAGLTLGGGLGWLMGKHGLACDNVTAMDVVTADGRLLKASEQENADLFWGLRGPLPSQADPGVAPQPWPWPRRRTGPPSRVPGLHRRLPNDPTILELQHRRAEHLGSVRVGA
jgi:FAD/FMN-containing dehydrogenase